jgi:hypothetical protein
MIGELMFIAGLSALVLSSLIALWRDSKLTEYRNYILDATVQSLEQELEFMTALDAMFPGTYSAKFENTRREVQYRIAAVRGQIR